MAKQEQDLINELMGNLETYLNSFTLKRKGDFFQCINPDHDDSDPSCSIGGKKGNKQIFHCFGCLAPNEEIRTQRGLIKIKDVTLTDTVLTIDGTWKKVVVITPTTDNEKPMIAFTLGNIHRDDSIFTINHRMLVAKDVYNKVPYINYSTYDNRFKFIANLKRTKRSMKYINKLDITECYANEVAVDDYFLFPVNESVIELDCIEFDVKEYTSGPKNDRINKLIINTDLMWVYGLYCAEGSSYRGGIAFTLCIDEMHYALKVKSTIEKYYSKNCTITERPDRNTITVHCSSTDLQQGFKHLFGVLSENKKCPIEFLSLSKDLQNNFLIGVFNGDSSDDYDLTITSKELVLQLEHMAINLQKPFTYSTQPSYIPNDGIKRLPTYTLRLRKYESLDCFYDIIDNVTYCFMRVIDIQTAKDEKIVYDLTVEGTPSFTTKHYTVHNCGVAGNIFHAAHYLENLPINGPEFFAITLTALAKRFGLAYSPTELSESEKERIQLRNAVNDASITITNFVKSNWDRNPVPDYVANIKARNITLNSVETFRIGAIPSIDEYKKAMLNKGWSEDYLIQNALLSNKVTDTSIFAPGKIIITISDALGRPIAFVARKNSNDTQSTGPKYVNSPDSKIYHKSSIFFGMDVAKKYIKNEPLYVVEGYIDAITLNQSGFKNVVALGSASFSKELLEFIVERNNTANRSDEYKIKHLVLCYDGDEAGTICTRNTIDLISSNKTDILVSVKQLPIIQGYHDPDEIIYKNGLVAYKAIEVLSSFKWDLKYHRDHVSEPEDKFIQRVAQQISNVDSPIERRTKSRDLFEVLSSVGSIFTVDDIIKEVEHLRGEKSSKMNAELEGIFDGLMNKRKTTRGSDLVELLSKTYADIKKKQRDYNQRIGNLDDVYKEQAKAVRESFNSCRKINGFKMNRFKTIERLFDGFPDNECLFAVAGDANIGKSTWIREISWDIAQSNRDAIVIYMSIDDSTKDVLQSIVAREAGLSRTNVYKYGYYSSSDTEGESDVLKVIDESWDLVLGQKNYIVADATQGSSIMHLEDHLDYVRKTYPDHRPIIFLDNFHKLRYSETTAIREKFIDMVQSLKELTQIENIPIVMSVELRKTETGKRATLSDIAETKQIEYDAKIVMMAHQEMHYTPETSIKWHRDNYGDTAVNLPYLEMNIAKNKHTDKKCMIGYRFEPDRSTLTEVDYDTEIRPKRFPGNHPNNR